MILGRLYDLALWPHPWPWPWSWNFKVKVWNSFISGMGRPIDMEQKGCESSIYDHDIDECDHGGVEHVPDSDWGDFKRRRAVDISSSTHWVLLVNMIINHNSTAILLHKQKFLPYPVEPSGKAMNASLKLHNFVTWGQFSPSGIVVACVCLSVCVSVRASITSLSAQ